MGTQAFKATVTNTPNTAVSWQVNSVTGGNAMVGTISTAGVYTPPAAVAATLAVTVTAVSVAVKTQSASAQVTIIAPRSGGGGAIDPLTLLAAVLLITWRTRGLRLALSHALCNVQPFSLRTAVVCRRNARLF
jgi:hypothetical protein